MNDYDRDRAVMEAAGANPDHLYVDREEVKGDVEALREQVNVLQERVVSQGDTIRHLVRKINSLQDAIHGDGFDRLTSLEKYTRMVENGEDDPLSASDHRAVAIHRHWDSLAERFMNGCLGVSTRKKSTKANGPSQLKVDLQHILGEELQNNQIDRPSRSRHEVAKKYGYPWPWRIPELVEEYAVDRDVDLRDLANRWGVNAKLLTDWVRRHGFRVEQHRAVR